MGKSVEIEHRLVVSKGQGWGYGGMRSTWLMVMRFPFRVIIMFGSHIEVTVPQHCTKCHLISFNV